MAVAMVVIPFAAQAEETGGKHENQFWEQSDCDSPPAGPAMRVELSDVNSNDGNIRLALYNMSDDEFLAKGMRIARIDIAAQQGDMDICLPLPRSGAFSMAVLHDSDADGHLDVFSEGYGFPNNPRLLFSAPDAEEASFEVTDGGTVTLPITMKYVYPKKNNRGPRGRR
jgi:uncharacterized protein (DUF2141 family)